MSKIKSLPGQRLCSSLPPDRVPWETSDAIPRNGHRKVAPQPRALKASCLLILHDWSNDLTLDPKDG